MIWSGGALVVVLTLVFGILVAESESTTTDIDRLGQNGQSGPTEQTSRARFNFFDGDLLQEVGTEQQGNFVISPASVKTLLGLMMEAAEGATLDELRGLLRLPSNLDQARQLMGSLRTVLQKIHNSQVIVDSATTTFISKDYVFNTSYAKAISDLYKAGVDSLDFKSPENAANRINSWVSTHTRGKIPSLIDADKIDPETITMLVNTVYFDGKWKEEFQLKDTNEECFYSEPRLDCHKVPMMYKKDELMYKYDKDFNSHIVELPYQDERFSMVLVVPVTQEGARHIARDTHRLTFPSLLDHTRATDVHLKLPRFSVEYQADLKLTLTKMGLNSVFSNEATLPYMFQQSDTKLPHVQGRVSAMIHKAKIEVSEKGTKAAAVSGASVVPLMSANEAVLVTADHPFYYFIYEVESKSVLFSGRISSLAGETGAKENSVAENPTPLSSSEYSKPSYAQATSIGTMSSNRPHNYPERQTISSIPTSTDVQFLGVGNQPYNKATQQKPSSSGQDAIQYPNDHGNRYLNDYRKRLLQNNPRPQQRPFTN